MYFFIDRRLIPSKFATLYSAFIADLRSGNKSKSYIVAPGCI